MQDSTKYTLEHIGDIVVEKIEQVVDWVSESTRGISLTCRIHCLEKEETKTYTRIGRQTVRLRKRYPLSEIFNDEALRELLADFDKVDAGLLRCRDEREARLYPRYKMMEQPT
ncbi:Magnetosome protein Mad10 [Desulfovibrionales bacterium]